MWAKIPLELTSQNHHRSMWSMIKLTAKATEDGCLEIMAECSLSQKLT